MNSNENPVSPSILIAAADLHVSEHAANISLKDLADWCYLMTARDTMLAHLGAWPDLSEEYYLKASTVEAKLSRGIITYPEYIELQVATAQAIVAKVMDMDPIEVDMRQPGWSSFEDDALHVWMVWGTYPTQEWCNHMPWTPETSKALQRYNLLLTVAEAKAVAEQWHPGMWSAMYSFASTGEIVDLDRLVKELAECLIEAGDVPRHATSLYNLVAYICFATQDCSFDLDEY